MKILQFLLNKRQIVFLVIILSVLIFSAWKENARAVSYETIYQIDQYENNEVELFAYNTSFFTFVSDVDIPAGVSFRYTSSNKLGSGGGSSNPVQFYMNNQDLGSAIMTYQNFNGSAYFNSSTFTEMTRYFTNTVAITANTTYSIGIVPNAGGMTLKYQTNLTENKVAQKLEVSMVSWMVFANPPSNNQNLSINGNFGLYTFSGTCPYNGTDRIYLENTDVSGVEASDDFSARPGDNLFDIDCVDHEWTSQKIILKGVHTLRLYDKYYWDLIPINNAYFKNSLSYNGVSATHDDYDLWITQPLNSHDFVDPPANYQLQPANNWPFQFRYQLTTSTLPSNITFNIAETDMFWATTSSATLLSDTISNLDPNSTFLIDTAVIPVSDEQRYFKAYLENENDEIVSFVAFRTIASSTIPFYPSMFSTTSPTSTNLLDSAWLSVFNFKSLPIIGSYVERIWNHTKSRFPWGYLDQIWTLWRSSSASGQDSLGFELTLTPTEGANATTTISMPLTTIGGGTPWYGSAYASKLNALEPKLLTWIWVGWGWVYLRIIFRAFKKKTEED